MLIGPEHHSDAGAYRVADGLALIQTVDFFAPLTDDPYVFGQIAAANSLSDCYAMGGRPITALNIVGFPDDELPLEVLNEILRGGAEKTHEAGAVILGGHTVRDTEIKYGLSVTGLADPQKIVSNAGAQAGDVLVLTKPIGTGAMTAAYQRNKIDAAVWEGACAMMRTLNRAASEAMLAAGVRGATDITGYGLLGHGSEMAEASGVTLEIEAAAVPLLEGAVELSRSGFVTRAVSTNATYMESRLRVADGIEPHLLNLITDAQTSGGLLIALPEPALASLQGALQGAPYPAVRIGRVGERGDALVCLI